MSVWEDFKLKYAPPKVEGLTVGFSGIDPAGYAATLTEEQLEMVKALVLAYISKLTIRIDSGSIEPDAPPPEVQPVTLHPTEIPHELLDGLMGGDEDGHYHLTDVQLDKLKALIQALVPNGEEVKIPVEDHEKLNSLMGGTTGQHYHFTSDEWTKLRKVLAKLFPDGATEPQFPSVPASTDEPSTPEEPEDPFGGLPKGTPPQWTQVAFPTDYSAWKNVHRMYFGEVPCKKLGHRDKELVVAMQYKNGYNYLMRYQPGNAEQIFNPTYNSLWQRMAILSDDNSTGQHVLDYVQSGMCDYLLVKGYDRYNFHVMFKSGNKYLQHLETSASSETYFLNGDHITKTDITTGGWTAGCSKYGMDTPTNTSIFVSGNYVATVTAGKLDNTTSIPANNFTGVNPGCAAWYPEAQILCLSSSKGTAISGDDGATWETRTNNLNLLDLCYRADLGCLFARSGNNKLFYVSSDGLSWQQLNKTPIPLDTIAAVDYNADLGWYCAVGGTSKYAYFSKDLEHWISTTVTNGAAMEMGSVIWCGAINSRFSINRYVIMPKSGTYFYTFDPTQWKN